MKKQTKTTPSVVSTPAAPVIAGGFTIGLDLGDRNHYVCVLDATGQAIHEGLLPNSRVVLALLLTQYPSAVVALEAGTHSPWISRYLRVRLKIASSWSAPAERSGDGAIVQAKRQRINKDFRAGQSGVALRLPPQSMTLRFIRHALSGQPGYFMGNPVAQTSKSAVSRVSKPANAAHFRRPADWEIGDTAGLETCATPVSPACGKAAVKFAG